MRPAMMLPAVTALIAATVVATPTAVRPRDKSHAPPPQAVSADAAPSQALPATGSWTGTGVMTFQVTCPNAAVYDVSAGTPKVTYRQEGSAFEVEDLDGNSAQVDCDWGCLRTTGAGSCLILSTASTRPAATSGAAEGPLVTRHPAPDPQLNAVHVLATVDITCFHGRTFTIGRGTQSGSCGPIYDQNHDVTGGRCDDGNGNTASVDCAANGGLGSCGVVTGSGTCSQKP